MTSQTGARLLLPLTRLGAQAAAPAAAPEAPADRREAPAAAPDLASATPPAAPDLASATPPVAPGLAPAPTSTAPSQRLDLDAPTTPAGWISAVRAAAERCLLLDGEGRVSAASPTMASVTGAIPTLGVRFAELVKLVDFTSGAAPQIEPERAMPPLRALTTGGLARGLMRLRVADGSLVTYDVVAVPLQGQRGVLAFFLPV